MNIEDILLEFFSFRLYLYCKYQMCSKFYGLVCTICTVPTYVVFVIQKRMLSAPRNRRIGARRRLSPTKMSYYPAWQIRQERGARAEHMSGVNKLLALYKSRGITTL